MKVIIGFVVVLLAASCAEDTPITPTADVLQAQPECPDGDQTVQIIAPNFGIGFAFEIDVYEASRFDATASSEGIGSEVACSISGVLPWREVTFSEASAACQAAGKRLCTSDEWPAVQLASNTSSPTEEATMPRPAGQRVLLRVLLEVCPHA